MIWEFGFKGAKLVMMTIGSTYNFSNLNNDGLVVSAKNVIASEAKQSLVLYLIVFIILLRHFAPRNDTVNDFLQGHQIIKIMRYFKSLMLKVF